MKKLRLEIDEIRVESFQAQDMVSARGTVHGHKPTLYETCSCDCSVQGQICTVDECTPGTGCMDTQCLPGC